MAPWITNLFWLSIYRISRWFKPSGYYYKPHRHSHISNYCLNKQLEVLSSPNGFRLLRLKWTERLPSFLSDIAIMLVHDSPKQTRTFLKWQNHWLRPTVSVRFSPPSLSFWSKNDVPLTGPTLVWWNLTLCSLQCRLMIWLWRGQKPTLNASFLSTRDYRRETLANNISLFH
jgi:hypothetical protein